MSKPNPATVVVEFVLERLSDEPIQRRITLTRALSQLAPTADLQSALHSMTAELEKIERQHQQMLLDFKRRAKG